MKVSTKLYGAVGALAAMGTMVAVSGIWYNRSLTKELDEIAEHTAVKIDLINSSRARTWEMVAALRGMFLSASLKDETRVEARAQQWDEAFKRTGEQITQIRPLLVTDQGKRDLARFEASLGEFQTVSADYMRLCREHKFEQVANLVPQVEAFASAADESLMDLTGIQRRLLKESQARSASLRSQSLLVVILVSCGLLVVVILGVLVVRGVNLTLARSVSELSEGAEQTASAATQVSSASQSLAQGSSEQAASLEETSASSEEINSMAQKNTENSGAAATLVIQSQQKFAETNRALDHMVAAMEEINASSDKISKIIKVIDEIAFQTNILALNAAVEAARAGEAGMGFAVVADEVRNLAQRCAQAAKDTAGMIEESIAKSNEGKTKVDQVAMAIRSITEESAKIKTLVDEVNVGSQEQARGIQEISKAIAQMEQVTQSTAANAEESASAAEELTAQSEALRAVVHRLSAMVGGGTESASHRDAEKPRRLSAAPALRAAVKHKPQRTDAAPAVTASKNAIPLEENFAEF